MSEDHLKVWEVLLTTSSVRDFSGVAVIAAPTKEAALELLRTDLDRHGGESAPDEREVTCHEIATPRVLSIHHW